MGIATLILAAGESRRFEGCKLLAPLGNGRCLLEHTLATAERVTASPVYIVTGAWDAEIRTLLATHPGVNLLFNPQWNEGLGASLAFAVNELAERYDGLLVLLADQVALHSADLQALLQQFNGENMVCAEYSGRRGVPAIFPQPYFAQLKQLTGDQGARSLLNNPDEPVITVPLEHAEIDIDTQTDLDLWRLQASV